MEETLRRVESVNPELNAFVSLFPPEQLLAEARRAADALARGEDLGPLAGLPLGVKDLEDAAGLPTTHGSLLFKDVVAERDTVQVERLKRAGAIVIGKTNTPEFGYTAFTTNRVYGTTRNPWNLACTPGGSSGGSSAALAGGLVALATASDGGGSVRIPAAFTGLVGLKPSNGRIPWGPEAELRLSGLVVSGPLTRCVRDAALWLDVTVGPDERDPYSLPHPGFSYVDVIERPPPRLRIAYNPTLGYASVAREVRREVETALQGLASCGHLVDLVEDPLPDVALSWMQLMCAEDYGIMGKRLEAHRDLLDPGYLPGMDLGSQISAVNLGEIQEVRTAIVAYLGGLFGRFDLLATPTVASPPFAAEGPLPTTVDGAPLTSSGGGIAFTYPFNFSAHPAISLRAGFTDDRLPVGLQLVTRRLREDLLLQVARQYEQVRPWADRWPRL
jgi:aspartyl-tRNA(Asn)/glutamyl-tRNA(Gln) amidotransferase subunit A